MHLMHCCVQRNRSLSPLCELSVVVVVVDGQDVIKISTPLAVTLFSGFDVLTPNVHSLGAAHSATSTHAVCMQHCRQATFKFVAVDWVQDRHDVPALLVWVQRVKTTSTCLSRMEIQ